MNGCSSGVRARGAFGPRLAAVVVLVLVTVFAAPATGAGRGPPAELTIYTQNLYVGTEFYGILSAETLPEQMAAIEEAYAAMVDSDPAARMKAVAREIAAKKPEVVALQEVSTFWRTSTEAYYDYLSLLLDSLDDFGAEYDVAATVTEFGIILPIVDLETFTIVDSVGLTDAEVILVRSDLEAGNPQNGHFTYGLPVFGDILTRGWCSADVEFDEATFRVVCTHLEEELWPSIRDAQAAELLATLEDVEMPVFLAGDFNSDPKSSDTSGTYEILADAGFADPWTELHGKAPGLTWGHDTALADPSTKFIWRLDLILYRGSGFAPRKGVVRDLVIPGGTAPRWASDHAGLSTTFRRK